MRTHTSVKRGFRRLIAAASIVAFLPLAAGGCFGKFELTRKVYKFNEDVSQDKWIRWFVFLGLSILPYPIATFIDALCGNSFEFWTGSNPLIASLATPRVAYGPNGEVAIARVVGSGVVEIEVTEADGTVHALTLVAEADGASARDAEGNLIARVRDVDGRPTLVALNP